MAGYTLRLSREGGVTKQRFDDLAAALDALEMEARAYANTEGRSATSALVRSYEPHDLVGLRAEIAGRGVHAGVDVRGDGAAEAFTGRVRRTLVAQQPGESPYDALRRRLLSADAG